MDFYIGQIMPAGFGVIPEGWHLCDGSLLAIQTNQALFALLSTTYGGDGRSTFALPDLRGRAVLGSSLDATAPWGQKSGTETVTVTVSELPSHNHMLQASSVAGSGRASSPTGKVFGVANIPANLAPFAPAGSGEVTLAPATNVASDGSTAPHNNMQPYTVINYMISLTGIFPSRP